MARRLLWRADAEAERVAAIVRMVAALVLLIFVELIDDDDLPGDRAEAVLIDAQIDSARFFLAALLLVGMVSYFAARRGWGMGWRPYVTVTMDAALMLGNLAHALWIADLPGNLFPVMPILWAMPIIMAGMVIHYRIGLQIYVGALYIIGIAAIWLWFGHADIVERSVKLSQVSLLFGTPADIMRLLMLTCVAAILVLVAWRGRTLLETAVQDAARRSRLSRFLPGEIAELLETPAGEALRDGRRQIATVVFVDIRNSTARAETFDPARLSVFISSFRRRVSRAAQNHGGLIDKFIGDGALLVFGVPDETPDAAARAIAFGHDLLASIERWNAKRCFDPPLRIGIGMHTGEVYCGLVGDVQRLEFTVLGDTVNVAARIEQLTKTYGVPMLASEATLVAADLPGWSEIANEPVRGRTAPIGLLAPAAISSALPAS